MVELEHLNIRFLCHLIRYLTERTHSLELQEGDHNFSSTGEVRERENN